MIHSLALVRYFLFLALSSVLVAQDTTWSTPPPSGNNEDYSGNPVYAISSEVQLSWATNMGSYSVWLWQQAGGDVASATCGSQIYTKADGQTEAGGTPWQVTTENFLLSANNVFFLVLGPYNNLTGAATTSHYFNITNAATTTSRSTLVPSSTSTVAPSSSTSAPAATSTALVAHSDGSSINATVVGLGVALGVGIPIILLLAGLLFLKLRKSKRADQAQHHQLPAYRADHSQSSEPMVHNYNKRGPAELPVELGSQSRI